MRCFVLMAQSGRKVYLYRQGYMRTASSPFRHGAFSDTAIHLTNTAVQSNHKAFGQFEEGNQLDWGEFQRCMDETGQGHVRFFDEVYPRLRESVATTARAVQGSLNPTGYSDCFELFGYDYMMDESLRLLLLEVNSNPSLEIHNLGMAETLQQLVDDIFVLTVDKAFKPPPGKSYTTEHNFDLVYDAAKGRPVEAMLKPWPEGGIEVASGSPKGAAAAARRSVAPLHVGKLRAKGVGVQKQAPPKLGRSKRA